MTPLAQVQQLWRYPVKSMRGERQDALALERRGVTGDRVFAVQTDAGKLGSGKSTGRFTRIDGLLDFGARLVGPVPEIAFPDGRRLRADDPTLNAALSKALGQPVTLTQESAIPHLDAAPVHLLTTASLAWLEAALPGSVIAAARFRPNVLVEIPGRYPVEQTWCGRIVRIGREVELKVVAGTERCRMVTLAQSGLPLDGFILAHLARHADVTLGVYAEVIVPGQIKRGDSVQLLPAS